MNPILNAYSTFPRLLLWLLIVVWVLSVSYIVVETLL